MASTSRLDLACPAVSQMDPHVWKDANEWTPSHWSDPQGVAAQAFNMLMNMVRRLITVWCCQRENGEPLSAIWCWET